MKLRGVIAVSIVLALLSGCTANPLVGDWRFNNGGAIVGLTIDDAESCRLSLSRFLTEEVAKDCKFSKSNAHTISPIKKGDVDNVAENDRYLIFLKDENGNCDVLADFEFIFDKQAGILNFMVGDDTFPMQKTH